MATAKSTRRRQPASVPKTQPKPQGSKPRSKPSAAVQALTVIRLHLEIVRSVAYVAGAALSYQWADSDEDVALLLRRCIGDELDRQIERLNAVIAGGAS